MADTSISPDNTQIISDTTSDTDQPTVGADAVTPPTQASDDSQPQGGAQSYMQSQQNNPMANSPAATSNPDAPDMPTQNPSAGTSVSGKPQDVPSYQQPAATNPLVEKAGWVFKTAQALAGGPRFKETINPETGVTERTQIPMSRGDIGMAIAMEALSGALGGLAEKGPGATGRAAAVGFGQQMQQREQADAQQSQQANADYARHAQILETNMRTWQNAQTVGRQNFDTNMKYGEQFKDLADRIQQDYPQFVKGVISESDMARYHVTKDAAMPTGNVVPTLDPKTGKQAMGAHGEPLWEHQYLVVDPSFKADGFLSDDDRKTLVEMHKQGFVDSDGKESNLPQSLPMKLSMGINLKSQIASYKLAKQDLNDYYTTLNQHASSGKPALIVPTIKNAAVQPLVDAAANKYGVPVALARAVANQESGGNPNAVSPTGAQGVMQLMPDTAKGLGVQDPLNPDQNIDAGVRYLGQLLRQNNGDVKLALASYNAGPGNVVDGKIPNNPETQNYIKSISSAIGLDAPAPKGDTPSYTPPDLSEEVAKDPTLVKALGEFQPLLNANQGNYQKAIGALGSKDPQAAGKILSLYGGTSLVNHFDEQTTLQKESAKKAADAQVEVDKEKALTPVKAAQAVAIQNALTPGKVTLAGQEETARQTAKTAAGVTAKEQPEIAAYFANDKELNATIDPKNVEQDGINHKFLDSFSTKNPRLGALVTQIIHGGNRTGLYGLAKGYGQELDAAVAAASPEYDKNKAEQYAKTTLDFGPSGKSGKALIAANTAFNHLKNLDDSVHVYTTGAFPGAKTWGDWIHSKDAGSYATGIANAPQELGTLYADGGSAHEGDVKAYRDAYTGAPEKVHSAIRQQAINAMDKVERVADAYYAAVPSTFVKPPTFLSEKAAQDYKALTGNDVDPRLIQHSHIIGDNGQITPKGQQAQQPYTPPPTARAGRDPQGNIVQYQLVDGTTVDAKTGQPVPNGTR